MAVAISAAALGTSVLGCDHPAARERDRDLSWRLSARVVGRSCPFLAGMDGPTTGGQRGGQPPTAVRDWCGGGTRRRNRMARIFATASRRVEGALLAALDDRRGDVVSRSPDPPRGVPLRKKSGSHARALSCARPGPD